MTRVKHLKAIEGIASDVRQARTTIISSDGFRANWGDSYECLFRLSGTPVALQVDSAIFIEHGETVRVSEHLIGIGLYPAPRGNEEFREELSGYEGGKGTVRFPFDKPIPFDLIRRIVKFRVKEVLENAHAKGKKK